MSNKPQFSHLNKQGEANIVDISTKEYQKRTAIASGKIYMSKDSIVAVKDVSSKKGDVLAVSRIAGIMASKETSRLIPLCHTINIDKVDVSFEINDDHIVVTASVVSVYKTGVEMEALTAVSVSCLTIYDMCKAIDKNMMITDIKLLSKTKENL